MITCKDIGTLLDKFLTNELGTSERQLFQEHLKNCCECNKKVEQELQIHFALESFYKEQSVKDIPPFDWDRFYTKMSSAQFSKMGIQPSQMDVQRRYKFGWLPQLAFLSLLGTLVIGLSIAVFYKIKNVRYLSSLQLPPYPDTTTDTHANKKQSEMYISSLPEDSEDYIKTQRRYLTRRKKTISKKSTVSNKNLLHHSGTLSGGVTSGATYGKHRESGIGGESMEKGRANVQQDEISERSSETLRATSLSPQDKSNFIKISLCQSASIPVELEMATKSGREYYKSQKTACDTPEKLKKIPLTVLANKKVLAIIEVIDPSCYNCSNSYELIKSVIRKYDDTVSYRILFYPVRKSNSFFYLFGASLLAADNQNKIQEMYEMISSYQKKFKSMSKKELRYYLLKVAKKIRVPDLKQFNKDMKSKHLKAQINEHIKLVEMLKVNTPSLLFFKERELMLYVGQQDEKSLENAFQLFLK